MSSRDALPLSGWSDAARRYLETAVSSEHTRRAYARAIADARRGIGGEDLRDLTGDQLSAYRDRLAASAASPATVAQRLAALRSFLAWAHEAGAHDLPPERLRDFLRTPPAAAVAPQQALDDADIGHLCAAATTVRDRALIAVLLGAGLRVSELVRIRMSDFAGDGAGGFALHVRADGRRRARTVPVHAEVARAIDAYAGRAAREAAPEAPIFRAHDRGAARRARDRLSPRAIAYLVARIAAAAGIDGRRVSPHALRHAYALRTLRYSRNVAAVSRLLGHARLSTTQRYAEQLDIANGHGQPAGLTVEALREAVPHLPLA